MTGDEAREHLSTEVDNLKQVADGMPSLPDKSDICMAIMYLNHCLKRLEEEVKNEQG